MKALFNGTQFDQINTDSRGCDYIEFYEAEEHNGRWYELNHMLMRCRHCDKWFRPDSIVVNTKDNVQGSMCVFCASKAGITFGRSGTHSHREIVEQFGGWYI